jgi:NO-binding membrane sensor protein with MHYT domain/two-component sensor histidine kinase
MSHGAAASCQGDVVFRTIDCLTQQHDYRLVVLALIVCALGSYAAITLLNHVRIAQGHARWGWLAATAVANGFSIWATHFIAMLAFSPGGPTGYDLVLTLLSLVAAIAVPGLAYHIATCGGLQMKALGGVLVGGGIATMHYTGMAAFRIAGSIAWDGMLVGTSVALGCVLGAAALLVGAGDTTWRNRLLGALFLTLAIFSHHFTAMGAASIIRDPTVLVVRSVLPPESMAVGVAIAGLTILGLTLMGVWLDQRDRRRTAAFLRDLAAAKKAEEQQNLLIAELDHRVKNVLARVAVVVRRTRESSHSMDHFLDMLDGRIQSMANTHALLSRGRWKGVPVADLVRRELEPWMGDCNVTVEGPDVVLSAEATQALAMVLHELVTNAAKYGALSVARGRVSVHWGYRSNGSAQGTLTIAWQEAGGPAVEVPARCGFGTSVIRDLIPYELGGAVELTYAADGVSCRIELPCPQHLGGDRLTNFTGPRSLLPPVAEQQAAT